MISSRIHEIFNSFSATLNLKILSQLATFLFSSCYNDESNYSSRAILAICELRNEIRTRTRARTLARVRCACEKHFETCVRCACVRPFFGLAMCDCTLAHFCTLFVANLAINGPKLLFFCNL